jgi:pyruvate dehydrogenase E2 component (dihydrolipoamide acetyltransferase)
VAHTIVMPSFGMYTAEGLLAAWLRPHGARVETGEPVLEIETEKATHEVLAPAPGLLHHIVPAGAQLTEQAPIGYVLTEGEAPPDSTRPTPGLTPRGDTPGGTPPAAPAQDTSPPKASPVARRLASEHGIDIARVTGTGPGGRIVEADVMGLLQQQALAGAEHGNPLSGSRTERRALSPMRRTIARRLRHSLDKAVSLTITREAEADALVDVRRRLVARGTAIPYDAFFVKLLAVGLREHAALCAFVEDDDLVIPSTIDIGVAVAVADGVVAPIVREADRKSISTLAAEIDGLESQVRGGMLSPEAQSGGVSTITNLGGFGVDAFTPVLNPPQSSILGIGRIRARPVVRDGVLAIANTCMLSLTFDHRVADGVPAAQLVDSIARHMNDAGLLMALADKET